jgi:hypothetical protein
MITTRVPFRRHGASVLAALASVMAVASCSFASPVTSGTPTGTSGPATYYLSPSGNDAAAGTSPKTPWRTLHRASVAVLPPGSRLLLQGGQRFTGELELNHQDAGNAARLVVISSYGTGRATIASGTGDGIFVFDTAGVEISDLNLVGQPKPQLVRLGSPDTAGGNAGISVYSNLPEGHRLNHVVISDIDATGFCYGIVVGGKNHEAGFSGVEVSNSDLHGNLDSGFESYGDGYTGQSPTYANQDIQVSHVIATDNQGDPHNRLYNTGNGIVLGSVQDGSVTWSTASGNGDASRASEGPEGIWTFDATNVAISHNISYQNKTGDRTDGNGFGIDQNTSNSVIEYNLSYGNSGAGYLLYSSVNDRAENHDILRYNISSDDDRDGNSFYAGITILGYLQNTEVYQNTVVMMPSGKETSPTLRLGTGLRGVSVRNNIFSTETSPVITASALSPEQVRLQGNDYYSVLGPWAIHWGSSVFTSLPDMRAATGEEMVSGTQSGFAMNPGFVGPVIGLKAVSPNDSNVAKAFALTPSSPLVRAGLDLASLGITPAQQTNFAGQEGSPQHPNVGAM